MPPLPAQAQPSAIAPKFPEDPMSTTPIVAVPAVVRRCENKKRLARITSNGTIAAGCDGRSPPCVAVIVANTDAYYPVRALLEAPLAIADRPLRRLACRSRALSTTSSWRSSS